MIFHTIIIQNSRKLVYHIIIIQNYKNTGFPHYQHPKLSEDWFTTLPTSKIVTQLVFHTTSIQNCIRLVGHTTTIQNCHTIVHTTIIQNYKMTGTISIQNYKETGFPHYQHPKLYYHTIGIQNCQKNSLPHNQYPELKEECMVTTLPASKIVRILVYFTISFQNCQKMVYHTISNQHYRKTGLLYNHYPELQEDWFTTR